MSEELPTGKAVFIAFMSIFLIFSIMGNILVVIVALQKKQMRNATNILIANLAVSDITLSVFVIPMHIHDVTHADEFHEGKLIIF